MDLTNRSISFFVNIIGIRNSLERICDDNVSVKVQNAAWVKRMQVNDVVRAGTYAAVLNAVLVDNRRKP